MYASLYRVAFMVARHVAIDRGREYEPRARRDALQFEDPPGEPVQSLGSEGEQPAPLRRPRRPTDGSE